jgi:hypothetical protein
MQVNTTIESHTSAEFNPVYWLLKINMTKKKNLICQKDLIEVFSIKVPYPGKLS